MNKNEQKLNEAKPTTTTEKQQIENKPQNNNREKINITTNTDNNKEEKVLNKNSEQEEVQETPNLSTNNSPGTVVLSAETTQISNQALPSTYLFIPTFIPAHYHQHKPGLMEMDPNLAAAAAAAGQWSNEQIQTTYLTTGGTTQYPADVQTHYTYPPNFNYPNNFNMPADYQNLTWSPTNTTTTTTTTTTANTTSTTAAPQTNLQSPPSNANITTYNYDNTNANSSPNNQNASHTQTTNKLNFEDYYSKDKIRSNPGVRGNSNMAYRYVSSEPILYNPAMAAAAAAAVIQNYNYNQMNTKFNYYPPNQQQIQQRKNRFKKNETDNEKSEQLKSNETRSQTSENSKKYSDIVSGNKKAQAQINNQPSSGNVETSMNQTSSTSENSSVNNEDAANTQFQKEKNNQLHLNQQQQQQQQQQPQQMQRNNYNNNFNAFNQYHISNNHVNYKPHQYQDINNNTAPTNYFPDMANLNIGPRYFYPAANNYFSPSNNATTQPTYSNPYENRIRPHRSYNYQNNNNFNDKYDPREFYTLGEKEGVKTSKFFVIKSYSKDDVIRSIKYNKWCSTEEGNRRLDRAFMQTETEKHAAVYLFFSINGSGQFCGVAQMMSRVDYDSKSEIWSQDKWKGTFEVKWWIVKDVPNIKLRGITLMINENKPVTNSRDTQEVTYDEAIQMLNVFRGHYRKTTILDESDS